MRYGELFAGAGGMSLGLERAGLSCAFHAELADFPRRVLTHRWPDTPLYGDVSALDGRELVAKHGAIDLLAGGSPCQDLSVAGKRAGLGGARSGLFYQQLRLWEETGATYLLWENVAGALSSNSGKDFAAVLSAIVGATVVVPRDGWGGDESGGGVAAGPRAVAAWRLLDAQWFGVPQRRLRVFVLGARAGGVDPAEVLLEPEGVRRNPPTRGEAGERTAARAGVGVASESGQGWWNAEGGVAPLRADPGGMPSHIAFDWQKGNDVTNARPSTMNVTEEQTGTLGSTRVPAVLSFGWQNSAHQGDEVEAERPAPLRVKTTPAVMAFSAKDSGADAALEPAPTLRAGGHTESHENGGVMPAVVAFDTTQVTSALNRSNPRAGDPCHPLAAQAHAPLVVTISGEGVCHALTHEGHDASEDGTGRGTPIIAYSLMPQNSGKDYKAREVEVLQPLHTGGTNPSSNQGGDVILAGCLSARMGQSQSAQEVGSFIQAPAGIPRRLMPIECERLMGWGTASFSQPFTLCFAPRENPASADAPSRKSPSHAGSAASDKPKRSASSAGDDSPPGAAPHGTAVPLRVEIDAATNCVSLRSLSGEWRWSASTVGHPAWFAPLVEAARSVHALAGSPPIAVHVRQVGRVASRQSTTPSTPLASGRNAVAECGLEIASVAIAVSDPPTTTGMSITSPPEPPTPSIASTWRTLFSYVVHAIAGCIPATTFSAPSCECELVIVRGWTDVPDEKGKPASDAARYKACGNGVVSNVAEWIAARLIAIEGCR